jgi:Alpha galactosidase A/NPCBM-associated, NEW3 domain of alpha-galactosidase/Alpha galactosidase C-terminal beta sandwich domain/Carbohydrate binding module (family 35)
MRKLICGLAAAALTVPLIAIAVGSNALAATAEANGVGQTPALGWSSWSFIRHDPTAADIEAQALAMKRSGLARAGFDYVNVDDFWYQCPGGQGPSVDQYGRWVIDATKFPAAGSVNGIQVVANYVHSLGLKFGLYVTPGISDQAVAQNTPIEGTSDTAGQIATTTSEQNYNCGGMTGIDYSKPGAQAFINSWASEFASWGVDYVKLDGVGAGDIPDVQAWSTALQQAGRPIHLELSNSLAIANASTWAQYSNGWRTGGDVECYGCESGGSSYPLTDWTNVESRFNQVAQWQPYGGPGAFNDYDSLEIGNGSNDGLTPDERQTQMSLWSLASSPLILGTDLTSLDATDLKFLKNRAVLSVDQDAIDASRIASTATEQVFAKTEKGGDVVLGLFNTGSVPAVVSTTAAAVGLPASDAYQLNNLWTHHITETGSTIAADVAPHGVALLRITPTRHPGLVPPATAISLTGPAALIGGQPATITETFADHGVQPVQHVRLTLPAPSGWTVTPSSPTSFASVAAGQTAQATFAVTAPAPTTLFQSGTLTGTADYRWYGLLPQQVSQDLPVTVSPPVQAPYQTYSSATDAPAAFAQSGQEFGISGAGADLFSGADSYSTIYLTGAAGAASTIETKVVSQQNMTGFAKAGLIVRNDMTGSGSSPEGVILFESPSGGIQLEWDSNGGNNITSVTPANETIPESLPVWLELVRNGSSYTGYYSYDGTAWLTVGTATVPGQDTTQDAGIFVTSHAAGSPGQAVFSGLTATASDATPPPAASQEAEAPANTLVGGAVVQSCTTCSGGSKVGFVGEGGTLTFPSVTVGSAGTYDVTIAYCDGSAAGRPATVSVNGAAPQDLSFAPTGSFSTVGTMTVPLQLAAGTNTIEFADPAAFTPDFDRIIVAGSPTVLPHIIRRPPATGRSAPVR